MSFRVAAFYRFVTLSDFEAMRDPLLKFCKKSKVRGTILLANEGINGTIAGNDDDVEAVLSFLRADPRLQGLEAKESRAEIAPFHRMKVKLKDEIVTMGVPDADPSRLVGTYLGADQWNELLSDPDVVVIDTRNVYEVEIGSFPGAISPQTRSFREFPSFVEDKLQGRKTQKVAMFCTGGIRCEKATSYLRSNGFENVFHLQGGILNYLETVSPGDNRWEGDCFVFDERVAVDRNLATATYELCRACRRPISDEDKETDEYIEAVSCPRCIDEYTDEQRQRFIERARQVRLAASRGDQHIGVPMPGPDGDDETSAT